MLINRTEKILETVEGNWPFTFPYEFFKTKNTIYGEEFMSTGITKTSTLINTMIHKQKSIHHENCREFLCIITFPYISFFYIRIFKYPFGIEKNL